MLDDFGKLGRAYRETSEAQANEFSIIKAIISGQFIRLLRVVSINTHEGLSRDVTPSRSRSRFLTSTGKAASYRRKRGSLSRG